MFDVQHLIESGGLAVIAFMVFAESGMMVGFLFPGDTLLLGAGILAAAGELPLMPAIIVIAIAAILGDNTGYCIGRYLGPQLFHAAGHFAHRKIHLNRARQFFRQYGSKTMLVAHFIPYVRSVAPVVAGAIKMPAKTFLIFDAVGDIAWAISLTLAGYFVGQRIPNIDQYIQPVIVVSTIVFVIPFLFRFTRKLLATRHSRHKLWPIASGPKTR